MSTDFTIADVNIINSELQFKLENRYNDLQARKSDILAAVYETFDELKQVCIREAELTGIMPDEYPYVPGDLYPTVRQRLPTKYSIISPPHQIMATNHQDSNNKCNCGYSNLEEQQNWPRSSSIYHTYDKFQSSLYGFASENNNNYSTSENALLDVISHESSDVAVLRQIVSAMEKLYKESSGNLRKERKQSWLKAQEKLKAKLSKPTDHVTEINTTQHSPHSNRAVIIKRKMSLPSLMSPTKIKVPIQTQSPIHSPPSQFKEKVEFNEPETHAEYDVPIVYLKKKMSQTGQNNSITLHRHLKGRCSVDVTLRKKRQSDCNLDTTNSQSDVRYNHKQSMPDIYNKQISRVICGSLDELIENSYDNVSSDKEFHDNTDLDIHGEYYNDMSNCNGKYDNIPGNCCGTNKKPPMIPSGPSPQIHYHRATKKVSQQSESCLVHNSDKVIVGNKIISDKKPSAIKMRTNKYETTSHDNSSRPALATLYDRHLSHAGIIPYNHDSTSMAHQRLSLKSSSNSSVTSSVIPQYDSGFISQSNGSSCSTKSQLGGVSGCSNCLPQLMENSSSLLYHNMPMTEAAFLIHTRANLSASDPYLTCYSETASDDICTSSEANISEYSAEENTVYNDVMQYPACINSVKHLDEIKGATLKSASSYWYVPDNTDSLQASDLAEKLQAISLSQTDYRLDRNSSTLKMASNIVLENSCSKESAV